MKKKKKNFIHLFLNEFLIFLPNLIFDTPISTVRHPIFDTPILTTLYLYDSGFHFWKIIYIQIYEKKIKKYFLSIFLNTI